MKTTELKSLIFAYPELPKREKRELERDVLFNGFQAPWLTKYEELALLVQKRGGFPVLPRGSRLGAWIQNQRHRRRINKMPLDRERALNRIGFVWDPLDHQWNKQFDTFVRYMDGELSPAPDSLKSWMSHMRIQWSSLSPRQRRLLRKAGLLRKPLELRGQTNLAELEVIYERQGNIDGLAIRLRHFVSRLRSLLQIGKLDAETKARCDRIGLVWSTYTPEEQEIYWNKRYAEAQEYVERFSGEVPAPSKWENRGLGKWVASQTKRWKTMSPERQELLRKLRVVEKHRLEWDNRYKQALALYLKLGPYRDRVYKDEDRFLKAWIARQRLVWDDLNQSQQERLRAIELEKNNGELGTFRRVKNALKALSQR